MKLHRNPLLLRSYALMPQRLIGSALARLTRLEHPQPAVQAVIRHWIKRGQIDMAEAIQSNFNNLDAFFLRDLRPTARPIGAGLVSPVDGVVVACGQISADLNLWIKGKPTSLPRLFGGKRQQMDLQPYIGGQFLTIFLTPDGYHHVHAPLAGKLVSVQWIGGRFFPQNQDALRHIPRIYERNERATLQLQDADNQPYLLSMVAASLVGGIEIAGDVPPDWRNGAVVPLARKLEKGERLGHFALGSTVVLLFEPGAVAQLQLPVGERVKMGQSLQRSMD